MRNLSDVELSEQDLTKKMLNETFHFAAANQNTDTPIRALRQATETMREWHGTD